MYNRGNLDIDNLTNYFDFTDASTYMFKIFNTGSGLGTFPNHNGNALLFIGFEGGLYSAQLCFGFGDYKLFFRKKYGTTSWNEWKTLTFQ